MRFFFDRSLAPSLCSAIGALTRPDGHQVEHIAERFGPETADAAWIGRLAEEGGWVVVTLEARTAKNRHERDAWRRSGLTVVLLGRGWARLKHWDQARRLVRWWPRIAEQAGQAGPGQLLKVPLRYRSGRLRR